MKPASFIAVVFLATVCVAQLTRFLLNIEAVIGGKTIPVWPSAVAAAFTGVLAVMLWRENRRG